MARSEARCSMGWCVGPVLAQADGVVGPRVDDVGLAERGQPDGAGACSRRRRRRSRPRAARRRARAMPFMTRAHAVLADAVVHLDASGGARRLHLRPLDQDAVVPREVGRAGHQARACVRRGVDALVDGVPGGQRGARLEGGQVRRPSRPARARPARRPRRPGPRPRPRSGRPTRRASRSPRADLLAVERRGPRRGPRTSGPGGSPRISLVARISSSPKGLPCASGGVGQVRRGPADVAAQDEEGGLGVGPVGRLLQRLVGWPPRARRRRWPFRPGCARASRRPRSAHARRRRRRARSARRS